MTVVDWERDIAEWTRSVDDLGDAARRVMEARARRAHLEIDQLLWRWLDAETIADVWESYLAAARRDEQDALDEAWLLICRVFDVAAEAAEFLASVDAHDKEDDHG